MTETLDRLRSALARRYLVGRELGRGGMSTVYAARDLRHNRDVAIKVFPPALAAAIGPERFKREIEITSKLSHPHILPLFDSGHAGGAMYYVMPMVQGESLRDRLDREVDGLVPGDALELCAQIAQALDHAHSLGVIHRDVSPDNVLIADGNALLADFGIARLVEGETLTESGMPFGTALYRSPEQASGHASVGPQSDIYSLACVLYECIGGREARQDLANRFSKPVPSLRKRRRGVTPAIDAALARGMRLDPSQRFSSANDFVSALRGRLPFRYRWRAAGRAAAVILVVGVGAAGFSIFRHRTEQPVRTRVLVGRFANRTGDRSLDVIGDLTTDYIARGLAETRLLEVVDSRTVGSVSAVSTRAATLVQGSIYRRGDQLHIETQLIDPRTGRVLTNTDPVEGPLSAATVIAEKLRQRLMGNFSALFGPGFEAWESASLPPSFEAYQEILAGDASVGNNSYGDGLGHYLRAAAVDSSYAGARALAVMAAALDNNCATADSIAISLQKRLRDLSLIDRGRVEWSEAQCHGDLETSFAAGKRVLASAPRSISFSLLTGVTALELFRPREAIAILSTLSPEEMQFSAAQRQFRTSFTGLGWHELGKHERELAVFRDGLRSMPEEPHFRAGELIALAALGRTDEIRSGLRELENGKVHYDSQLWSPAQIRLGIGTELKAHGYEAEGNTMLVSGAQWSRAHLPRDGSIPVDVVHTHRLFVPIYYADMFAETKSFYENVLRHDSLSAEAHEALGAIAARRHDALTMNRMDAWLISHPSPENGRNSYSRARIAALAGQSDRALSLLEKAMTEGLRIRMNIHADPDMAGLRRSPRYQKLIAVHS